MKEWLSKRTIFDVRCRSCDFNGPVPMVGEYVSLDAPMEINFNGEKCPGCGNVDVLYAPTGHYEFDKEQNKMTRTGDPKVKL
ncbi:TPA: hypothetical protein NVL90_003259 [Klebsiella oxytoca]|nr:hypothetical protein [Klebsiella oxytoca]HCJ7380586.1 hypothetical protein [Klebsiella oxytoca]